MILWALVRSFLHKLDQPENKRLRIKTVFLFSLSIYLIALLFLGYAWYTPQWISSFHFFNDLPEWKQMDKVAHFFWTFQVSALLGRLFSWAKVDERPATILGAGIGFLFVSGIEVADGFSTAYGASVFDVAANALGACFFFAQKRVWKQILMWPKFSFHPSSLAPLRPDVLGNGFLEEVLKDYNGQTFWYSFSIPRLPIPRWLTLAVGVAAEGMVFGRDAENAVANFDPYRRYFLSFDLNFAHIQTSSRILNSLLYFTKIIKIPAPTLEISTKGIRFHPIYF